MVEAAITEETACLLWVRLIFLWSLFYCYFGNSTISSRVGKGTLTASMSITTWDKRKKGYSSTWTPRLNIIFHTSSLIYYIGLSSIFIKLAKTKLTKSILIGAKRLQEFEFQQQLHLFFSIKNSDGLSCRHLINYIIFINYFCVLFI